MKPFTLHRKFIPLLLFALCLMGTAGLSAQSSPEVESSLNIVQIIPASASGNLVVDLQTTLRNTGDVDLTNLQVSSDLGTQFGTVFINFDDFTPNPITNSTATTAPVYSDALSGADMLTLFDGTSGLLQPGEEISVRYRLQLDPNAVGGPSDFATQIAVTASALDPVTGAILMDPVSGAPVKVSDVSGNGTQPDDSNMPTPVSPYLANLSVGMQLLEVTSGSTMNSLHYNFSIVMKNTGSTSLDGLRLSNDLTQVLGSMYDGLVGSASIVNSTAAVTPTLNDDFGQGTGQGDIFALGGNNGLLLPGQEVEVQFTARVLPTGMNAMMGLSNQAIGSGRALSAAGVPIPGITGTPSYRVSDLSDDTPNPENNNGNGANDPTLLNFAMAFVEQLPGSLTFDPYLQDVDQVIQDFLDDNGGFVVSTPPGCQPAVFTNNYDPANFVQSCAQGFGTNNFSFFYSDACGNSMSFPASISIVDNTGPSCAKPDDVDLGCSPSDNLTALNDFFNYDGQITDLALPVTIETNITAADIIAAGCTPGSQDVDFIFTDACGNVTIRTATISFGDDEAPVFTSVPADQTIDCPATPQPGLATATDNCDSDVMVTFTDSGDATCPAGGVIVRTFTATDNCGNTATTTQTITVNGGGGNDCAAEAGTSEPVDAEVALINGTATIAATPNGNQFVPAGFSQFFVLTNDADLTILAINNSGSFQVTDPGAYRISVVVAQISDPGADDFFDLSVIEFGVTTGFELLNEFGDDGLCGSVDVTGSVVVVTGDDCAAEAGTSEPVDAEVALTGGTATIAATPNGNQFVPAGFSQFYVLTNDADLTILAINNSGSFQVSDAGVYRISVVVAQISDPNADDFFDLSLIDFGVTTGFDLLSQFGDVDLCGSVDVTGSTIVVTSDDCAAEAGTSEPVDANVALTNGTATIAATPNGNQFVPAGFSQFYVLTNDADLTILAINNSGSFQVTQPGVYRISVVVAQTSDPNADDFFDLGTIDFGVTTGFDLLSQFGDTDLCGSVDVTGSVVTVTGDGSNVCTADAGTSTPVDTEVELVNGMAMISATANGNQVLPTGYEQFFVLTNNVDLTILAINDSGTFGVSQPGTYRISVVVAETSDPNSPNFFDLSQIDFGVTTGFDLLSSFGNSDLCGSVDVTGSTITVTGDGSGGGGGGNDDGMITFAFIPANVTLACGQDLNFGNATAMTTCPSGGLEVTVMESSTGSCDGQSFVRTFTATDNCGNEVTATQTVTRIADTQAPVFNVSSLDPIMIFCPDAVVFDQVTATDNCSDVTITFEDVTTGQPCPNASSVVRTYTATDACGNSSTISQVVTIEPQAGVDITFTFIPQDASVGCGSNPAFGTPTAVTNCPDGVVNIVFSDATSGDCSGTFSATRTFTATDNCGNVATASQTITTDADTEAPVFAGTNPTSITADCGAAPVLPVAFDNCSATTLTYTDTNVSGDCATGLSFTRTWTATDLCGNSSTFSQMVTTGTDNTAPTFTFVPFDTAFDCDEAIDFADPIAIDNCSDVTITFVDEVVGTPNCDNGFGYDVYRTFTATDACGNSSTAQAAAWVIPGLNSGMTVAFRSVPADQTIDCGEDFNFAMPTCRSICGPAVITFEDVMQSGSCMNDHVMVRTWTATDDCGSTVSVSRSITREDTEFPVAAVMPQDKTIACGTTPVFDVLSFSDNCSAVILNTWDDVLTNECSTTYRRTWTAADGCGNTTIVSQDLTEVDEEAPEFVMGTSVSITTPDPATYVPVLPLATDNCSAAFVQSNYTTESIDNGVRFVFTAMDACGNASTQVLNVTYAEGETNTSGPTTDFTIFPNPTDGLVTVVFDSALQSAGQIELYDVFGKMLLQQPVSVTTGANRFQVNFPEGAPEGTYLIRLHTASVDAQHRVMRVRN